MLHLPLGPVMMDVQGTSITEQELLLLQQPQVGGVILFTRNFASIEQLYALVADIKSIRSPALLVSVDHEGGRVQRFREGFTVLPALAAIGKLYDKDQTAALEAAKAHAWLMATELLAAGIDFSFAPVLDVDVGLSSVIGDRSFHHNKNVVAELGAAYLQGMHSAGMSAVGKHFPGHGQVQGDTHKEKPVDYRQLNEILDLDGHPFSACLTKGLDAVMPAHVVYEAVDDCPAGYSSYWLQTILRERLGFKGVIFSDDLSMAGADTGATKPLSFAQRAERALRAGCDMVLVCNDISAATDVIYNIDLGFIPENDSLQALERRLAMQAKQSYKLRDLKMTLQWQQAVEICQCLQT